MNHLTPVPLRSQAFYVYDLQDDLLGLLLTYYKPSDAASLLDTCRPLQDRQITIMGQTNLELESQFRADLQCIALFAQEQLGVLDRGIVALGQKGVEALRLDVQEALNTANWNGTIVAVFNTLYSQMEALQHLCQKDVVDGEDIQRQLRGLCVQCGVLFEHVKGMHDRVIAFLDSSAIQRLSQTNVALRGVIENFKQQFSSLMHLKELRSFGSDILQATKNPQLLHIDSLQDQLGSIRNYDFRLQLQREMNELKRKLLATLNPEALRESIAAFSVEELSAHLNLSNAAQRKKQILDRLFALLAPSPQYLLPESLSLSDLNALYTQVRATLTEQNADPLWTQATQFLRQRLFRAALACVPRMDQVARLDDEGVERFINWHLNNGQFENTTQLVLVMPNPERQRYLHHICIRTHYIPAATALFEQDGAVEPLYRALLTCAFRDVHQHLDLAQRLIAALPESTAEDRRRETLLCHVVRYMRPDLATGVVLAQQIQLEESRNLSLSSLIIHHLDTTENPNLDQVFHLIDEMPQGVYKTQSFQAFAPLAARAERFDLIQAISTSAGNDERWLTQAILRDDVLVILTRALTNAIKTQDRTKAEQITSCLPNGSWRQQELQDQFNEAFPPHSPQYAALCCRA